MLDLSFITRVISLAKLKSLLWERVKQSFIKSFNNTNIELDLTNSKPNPNVIEYLKQRQFVLCEKTRNNMTGNLKFELLEAINNNESITEVTQRLNKIFNTTRVNTERIARTEILNAHNAGEFNAHVQSGVAKWKMWVATPGNRTAADSKRLNGQIQPIEKSFVDPKTGDECMHSPNRPNCRCSIHYLHTLPKTIQKHGMMYKA